MTNKDFLARYSLLYCGKYNRFPTKDELSEALKAHRNVEEVACGQIRYDYDFIGDQSNVESEA